MVGLGASMFRFSWAITVLGAQQAANLIAQSASGRKASVTLPLDAVANAAEGQFEGVLRGAYSTGQEYLPQFGGERAVSADTKA